METDNLSIKRDFIIAYFENFAVKIERVKRICDLEMVEEAVTLVCCYIESLGNLRYGSEKGTHANFITFLQNYSDHGDTLLKINISYLLNRGNPRLDKRERIGKLTDYDKISPFLKNKLNSANPHNEIAKELLIKELADRFSKLDKQNLEQNLDRFTYAEFLYQNYRGKGVHFGGIPEVRISAFAPLDSVEEPVFFFHEWAYFKADSIINFLETSHANLAKECENESKWPHELS